MRTPLTKKSRRLSALSALAAAPLLLAACGGSSGSPAAESTGGGGGGAAGGLTTITLGYHPDVHSAGLVEIGKKQGFWKQVGLKVVSKEFSSGPTEVQALTGGDIQFGYIGPGATWMAASKRATVVSIDSFSNGDYVITQPDITSLSQLKGKRVGYPTGTSGEMILRLALRKAGLSMDDIQKRPLDADAVVPAFVTHKIDAAAIWVPLAQTIREKVKGAHFLARDDDFSEYKFPESWIVSPSYAKDHKDVVEKFLKGFALANDYRMQHMDEAVQVTAQATGVPADALQAQADATTWMSSSDMAKAYHDGTADAWFQKLAELFQSMGELQSVPPPSQWTAYNLFPTQ